MPKATKQTGKGGKTKVYSMPTAQKKRDLGIPKFALGKATNKQAMPYGKSKPVAAGSSAKPTVASLAAQAAIQQLPEDGPSSGLTFAPIDSSLTRDSSSKAFMRELRKVIERSDVIIQVLDSRDPEGTRSRWVEDEVRKRDLDGKKLLAVMNKIDLVPRANLEAWMKHLRHSFPVMPFKSSTQSQRTNLSQNAVPIATPASSLGVGQTAPSAPALPATSSSLGAPALLHLLKQYALSTPHSSLTVGVVGYPNVGKSSLINSLKRSRACAVAAMPGKTRVVQEVVLDKGVKIVDCPGVVLEDVAREADGEEGRKKQAEIMLRNCIKAELVDDPISPVEVILSKVDPAMLQKLYNIPPYDDVRDFLIKIALTRGRLGKGGIPDLEGSAVSILRDWNTGKIPYFTIPPAVHASSMPSTSTSASAAVPRPVTLGDDVEMSNEVGDAKILNNLSEAFTIDGLFDHINDEAAWDGPEEEVEMEEDDDGAAAWEAEEAAEDLAAAQFTSAAAAPKFSMDESDASDMSDDDEDDIRQPTRPLPISTASRVSDPSPAESSLLNPLKRHSAHNPLFTKEELAVLSPGVIDRAKLKSQAKKAKKRQMAQAKTEGELMYGMMGMDVEPQEPQVSNEQKISNRQLRKDKKKARDAKVRAEAQGVTKPKTSTGGMELDGEVDIDQKKEADFAAFLANVGADSDEEL